MTASHEESGTDTLIEARHQHRIIIDEVSRCECELNSHSRALDGNTVVRLMIERGGHVFCYSQCLLSKERLEARRAPVRAVHGNLIAVVGDGVVCLVIASVGEVKSVYGTSLQQGIDDCSAHKECGFNTIRCTTTNLHDMGEGAVIRHA